MMALALTRCPVRPEGWQRRILDRINIDEATGCWVWQGSLDKDGYGKFRFVEADGRRRQTGPHRAAWLAFRGDIATGLVIDHLCRNRSCANPDHLEPVTNRENSGVRADHTNKAGRSGRRKGTLLHSCGKHGREDGYLHTQSDGYTRWVCRICRYANVLRHRAKIHALNTQKNPAQPHEGTERGQ